MSTDPHYDWVNYNGDETLRLDYDLTTESLVFDVGGYGGSWAYAINEKYGCNVTIYEPVKSFFDNIEDLFKDNPKVEVKNLGISSTSGIATISIPDSGTDGSSIFSNEGTKEEITLEAVANIIPENGIDLMKLNVEGCEYDILESLIAEGLHTKVRNMQVQFHNFSDDSSQRRDSIREKLKETHIETYCYRFVWENWQLR